MKKTKRALLGLAIGLLSLPIYAAQKIDHSGKYICEGYDPFEKSNYTLEMTMTKAGDIYTFKGEDQNKVQYEGSVVLDKNDPRTLAMICLKPDDLNYRSVAIYKVKSNGVLQGTWTMQGHDTLGMETCKKAKS